MKKMIKGCGKHFVYIVKCADKTFYTGYTNNLTRRLEKHNNGVASKYTRARLPVGLVWHSAYRELSRALKAEAAIKKLTRRQKELLVRGECFA